MQNFVLLYCLGLKFFLWNFSIGYILGCAWICFVGTWSMFPFLKIFWSSDISAICLSEMFLNGDDGAGLFSECTRLLNTTVAFSDADLNGIAYPWGKFHCI